MGCDSESTEVPLAKDPSYCPRESKNRNEQNDKYLRVTERGRSSWGDAHEVEEDLQGKKARNGRTHNVHEEGSSIHTRFLPLST